MPFVLGVGLLYKNMKTIDISIDGISVISIISFVVMWRWLQTQFFFSTHHTFSLLIAAFASIVCGVVCYILLYCFIHKLKINAIFAGIIFSFVLYAISVLAIGESLSLSNTDNYKFFSAADRILPYLSLPLAMATAFFFRTKLGLSIRATGENEKSNGTIGKQKLLILGFIVTGLLVGYGAFCYAVKEDCARSGGGFDFVITSLSSFLLVDKLIDFLVSVYKKNKKEEVLANTYYLTAFMQNAVVKAVIGSILFQTLSVIIIHYTDIAVLWKLFLGLTLLFVVARFEFRKKNNHRTLVADDNIVIVDNVSFSYTSGYEKKSVFENITVLFNEGINIIRGENGVGKTTLLKLINNELPVEKGSIGIKSESRNVFYLRQNALSGCAGEMTVYENIINVLPDIASSSIIPVKKLILIVREKIKDLGLEFDFLEDQSVWMKQMNQLSGGQIQKMSCLMALLSNCGIILADEPTSGLDDNNLVMMQQFFYKLKELGKNVIIVSHDNRIFDWDANQYKMTNNSITHIIRCTIKDWFTEEYGFFGDFYYICDNSFEGPYKDNRLSRTERTKNEVNMIVEMLGVKPGDTLFDCPCGWGRHSIGLAERGVEVKAIDLNRQYLNLLREDLKKKPLDIQSKVIAQRNDMRSIPLQGQFDFGINMFSAFGFFNDDENFQVVCNFYNLLKPNGKLLIHLDFNAERLIQGFGFDYAPKRNIFYKGTNYTLDVEKEYHDDDKRLHGLWKLTDEKGAVTSKMYSFRIYNTEEMRDLLLRAGFRSIKFYSSNQKAQCFDDIDTVIIAEK